MNQAPTAVRSALVLAGFILVTFCAPLAGMFSLPGAWYAALDKPSWNPPAWIFGPAWTLLYTLMAIAAWLVWRRAGWQRPLPLYFVQLLLNAAWTACATATPEGSKWIPIPELSDEFNGKSLDATKCKWHDHNPTWQGRQPGFFSKANVTVIDGKLQLRAKAEDLPDLPDGYHGFTTAAVQSKALVKYGYFEIKCRPMKSKASSAFWFYQSTPAEWTEIDVFEICGAGPLQSTCHTDAHVFHSPTVKEHLHVPELWKAPFILADEDHVYALEWSEKTLRWYVDGKVVREMKNQHWHQPLTLNFDSETMPDWFGLPEKSTLPAVFSIDYVRAWRKESP